MRLVDSLVSCSDAFWKTLSRAKAAEIRVAELDRDREVDSILGGSKLCQTARLNAHAGTLSSQASLRARAAEQRLDYALEAMEELLRDPTLVSRPTT